MVAERRISSSGLGGESGRAAGVGVATCRSCSGGGGGTGFGEGYDVESSEVIDEAILLKPDVKSNEPLGISGSSQGALSESLGAG